jgi:YidC/Oxa1 family membrane protein insertase
MQREMMALQQQEGFNPLAGCLPMFLQIPIFIALYHVLRHLANSAAPLASSTSQHLVTLCGSHPKNHLLTLYSFSKDETCSAATAKLFGAPLAASFHDGSTLIRALGGESPGTTRTIIVVLLFVSAAATLITQLLVKWNAPVQPEGTAATVQKVMLYLIPLGVLASGLLFNFPLGVLLYWFTSNLWTLGQQGYIIRFHPHEEASAEPKGELGKTLAPKPGQRPVRVTKGDAVDDADDATPAKAADRGTPRPGQKPNRPGAKRPPAKRPPQSKKRR